MFFTEAVKTTADVTGEGITLGTIQEENARGRREFLGAKGYECQVKMSGEIDPIPNEE